jgi:hypothetical protein
MMPIRELADSWASIYANSAAIRSAVAFAHLGGLVSGGGCAVAADLGTLGALRRGFDALAPELARLHRAHRLVVSSLVVVTISGVLLMLADLDAYLASSAFWIKMALVVALGVNGAALMQTGGRAATGDARAVARLKLISLVSLTLWFGTTLMGSVLPNAL